jgi:hypothetical protein
LFYAFSFVIPAMVSQHQKGSLSGRSIGKPGTQQGRVEKRSFSSFTGTPKKGLWGGTGMTAIEGFSAFILDDQLHTEFGGTVKVIASMEKFSVIKKIPDCLRQKSNADELKLWTGMKLVTLIN